MRENRNLEYKEQVTDSFLKTVSAFANFNGGTVMFGVTDNAEMVGVENPAQTCLDIENKINDSIKPKPDYSLEINKKTKVVSLLVEPGPYKPYTYRGKAYRRSDTATVEVDPLELKRLVLEGSNLHYEELPCKEQQLTFRYFESALIKELGISKLTTDMLRTFGFYDKKDQLNTAAALFADANDLSGIDLARFGASLSEISERATFARLSVLEQYDQALTMYRRYYQSELIDTATRRTVHRIPEVAFREVLANALVQRTWDIQAHIRILMFNDKIELISPGGLPGGVRAEDYLQGYVCVPRNPIVATTFFRLHLIENFGTGIRRIKGAYEQAQVKPSFELSDNAIKVILPCLNAAGKVSSAGQRVLDLLHSGLRQSSSELAQKLGFSRDKTIRLCNALLEGGFIQKIGNGRGTAYALR